ncbi:MAG: CDP-alcohol phosphatidyltransferase family protein [Dongiaceae bacterium]
MASLYDLKPRFQAQLRPLAQHLAKRGITPNQVTLAAVLLSVLVGGLVALADGTNGTLLLLPLALFARMALNAIDGMLAREHGMASDLGAALNELGDIVSDAALYLPLALVPGAPAAWIVLFVVASALTEMAGLIGPMLGRERRYDGPMGKSDRALVVGALALLLGLGVPTGFWLSLAFAIAFALAMVTVMRRVRAIVDIVDPSADSHDGF